jgi:ABC-type amino acid transport substrate-binding protein
LSDVLLNLIITIGRNMSESSPSSSAPPESLKKKAGIKPWLIAVVAIVIVVALIAVVVLGGFLNSNTNVLDKIKKNGEIRIGTQVPYPPFEFYNTTSGKYEGIDMEIAQKIADSLNVTLKIVPMEFDPLFGAVQTGVIDCAISSITITTGREKTVNFTTPYYVANQAVLVKNSSTITNIDGLNNTKVVAQLGTTGAIWAKANLVDTGRISSSQYTDLADVAAAVQMVQNGQQNVFIVDTPVANRYSANTADFDLKVAFVIQTNENYGICIQQNQKDLRDAINKVINDMKANGSMEALLQKWL